MDSAQELRQKAEHYRELATLVADPRAIEAALELNRVQFENRGPAARTGDPECGQFSRATNGGTVGFKLGAV